MHAAPRPKTGTAHARLARIIASITLLLLTFGTVAQPSATPQSPAAATPLLPGKLSQNVAVIQITGPLDASGGASIVRRIAQAQASGADTLVMQIDCPDASIDAALKIASALRTTAIPRTVAWIDGSARSGSVLIALACTQIVTSQQGIMGDKPSTQQSGRASRRVPRGQFGFPLDHPRVMDRVLVDLTLSARQHGHDEKLVQSMVVPGVELWLVKNQRTGERFILDRLEWAAAIGGEPPAGTTWAANPRPPTQPWPRPLPSPPSTSAARTEFLPASPVISAAKAAEISQYLTVPTTRKDAAALSGLTVVAPLFDGKGQALINAGQMREVSLALATIDSQAQLSAALGASSIIVVPPAWYERFAAFLNLFWVKGTLTVVMILCLALEFLTPGASLPGVIATAALVLLVLPDMMLGVGGWLELGLIIAGVALLAVELFVTPGLLIAGITGMVCLIAGIMLAFVPAGMPIFPGAEQPGGGALWALAFIAIGLTTAGAAGYFISKHMRTLPVFQRMVLGAKPADEESDAPPPLHRPTQAATLTVGARGIAVTPLRPAGKADFAGTLTDVVSAGEVIPAGSAVMVVESNGLRTVVEVASPL